MESDRSLSSDSATHQLNDPEQTHSPIRALASARKSGQLITPSVAGKFLWGQRNDCPALLEIGEQQLEYVFFANIDFIQLNPHFMPGPPIGAAV